MKKMEILVIILGAIGFIFLIVSLATSNSGNIRGLGSAFLLIPHAIILIISLVFLYECTFSASEITKSFAVIISILAILNSIFLFTISFAVFNGGSLVVLAILELLPLLIFYRNRQKITQ